MALGGEPATAEVATTFAKNAPIPEQPIQFAKGVKMLPDLVYEGVEGYRPLT